MGIPLNRIYNESCLTTMAGIEGNFIDLSITSPPYDSLRTYGNLIDAKTIAESYTFPFEQIAHELFRITKPGGVLVWVVGDATVKGSESGNSFRQALYFKECGFDLFDTMIYAKPPRGAVGNNSTYWQSFEYMFVLSKGYPKTINLIKDRKNKESRKGDRGTKRLQDGRLQNVVRGGYEEYGRRTNIWEYHVGKGHSTQDTIAFEHPAIFPEKLALDHIRSWSNEGDIVYDPMSGSGTVAKMCLLEKRIFLGSEINEKYYRVAIKRLDSSISPLNF